MENNLDPVDIALTFVGSNNRSIFNDWFYTQKGILTAYCGTFVSYCRSMGQMPLGRIDYTKGFAGVPFAVKFYSDKQMITDKPVRNDICFFDWSGQKKNFEHTGLFIKDNGDGTFQSVEGNTSNPAIKASTSQSNGGYVEEKTRSYNTAIFAHPTN
jgi:hypothetical protein